MRTIRLFLASELKVISQMLVLIRLFDDTSPLQPGLLHPLDVFGHTNWQGEMLEVDMAMALWPLTAAEGHGSVRWFLGCVDECVAGCGLGSRRGVCSLDRCGTLGAIFGAWRRKVVGVLGRRVGFRRAHFSIVRVLSSIFSDPFAGLGGDSAILCSEKMARKSAQHCAL